MIEHDLGGGWLVFVRPLSGGRTAVYYPDGFGDGSGGRFVVFGRGEWSDESLAAAVSCESLAAAVALAGRHA